MKPSENPLGSEPVSSLLRRFAIPSVIAMLVSALYNMVDQLFIGHSIGVLGNAATNVAFPLSMVCTSIGLLCGIGGAANFNLCMGRKDPEHAKSYVGNAISMLAILGVILCVAVQLFLRPMMLLFGATPDVIDYACTYTRITSIGFPFLIVTIGGSNLIRADGSPKFSMLCNLVGAIVNTILDPLFIFVFHMGVAGAAVATIISQALSAAWVLRFLCSEKSGIRLKKAGMKPDFSLIGQIMALGVSPFVMSATESAITIVMNHGLQVYGGDLYVGSMTILQSVLQLVFVPISGFTNGVQPIISYNFGAGKFDRVKMTIKRMISITFLAAFVYVVFAMLRPGLFARLFTTDEDLIALVKKVLPVYIAGMSVFGVQSGVQSSFLGLGQAKISLCIALLRKVILLIPLALILPRFFGVMGVYYAEPVADILSVLTASTLFLLNIRKILSKEMLAKVTHTT